MSLRSLAVGALALALAPAGVVAQAPGRLLPAGFGAGAAVGFESYRFGDPTQTGIERISLLTVPIAAEIPLVGSASLGFAGAYARGALTRADGSTTTLQGLTDSQLSLSLPVKRGVATVTAVVILPTGKSSLSADQAVVAGVVASELLPFRISNWGAGGAAGVSTAVAHSFGALGVGASAAYLVARQYDLVEPGAAAYRPGNQLRARLALDLSTGPAGKASLQLTYLHSQDDRFSGANVFRPGDRFQAMGSYAFAAGGRASGIVYAGVLRRARGAYLVTLAPTATAENLFLAGGGARIPLGRAVVLPSLDLRVLRRTDTQNEGEVVGVGGSAEAPLAPGLTLVPSVRARFGRVQANPGSTTGFNGFDLGLGLRFGGGAQ